MFVNRFILNRHTQAMPARQILKIFAIYVSKIQKNCETVVGRQIFDLRFWNEQAKEGTAIEYCANKFTANDY